MLIQLIFVGSTVAAFVAQAIFLSDPGTMLKVFKGNRGADDPSLSNNSVSMESVKSQEPRNQVQLE
jgi:hypothetical protein